MGREFQAIVGDDWPGHVKQSWLRLTESCTSPSYVNTYEWSRATVDHLVSTSEKIALVLAYQGEELEAIFLLSKPGWEPPRLQPGILHLLHHAHINLHDIVLRDDVVHRDLLRELFAYLGTIPELNCHALKFGSVLNDSAVMQLLRDETTHRLFIEQCSVCDCIQVMSETDLRKHISKNFRGNLRKARNKLGKLAGVESCTTREPEQLRSYFQDFLDVEASGWKGEEGAGTAIKLQGELNAFYEQLMESFGRRGCCEINLLRVDGKAVAGQFSLIVGRRMFLLKIGYDEEYSKFSPGNLLLADTLDRLKSEGEISTVNLITDAAWHASWRPEQHPVHECWAYNTTVKGVLLFIQGRLWQVLRSCRNRLRRSNFPKAARRF